MRILTFLACFLFSALYLSAQGVVYNFNQYFDPGQVSDTLYYEIDTINNQNNIWYRGKPNKTNFTIANSLPNALFTSDSISYPINDTSSFTVIHQVWENLGNGGDISNFQFKYAIDSDSFYDYGILEMSIDRKKTWINLISDTANIYGFPVQKDQRYFSGPASVWVEWGTMEYDLTTFFQDHQRTGDSIYIRFTFISDSIQNNRDGWIIDDIFIVDGVVGIKELGFTSFKSKIYPNPSVDHITVSFENPKSTIYTLIIYDNLGKEIGAYFNVSREIIIDLKNFSNGIYSYRLFSKEEKQQSIGKFVVEE